MPTVHLSQRAIKDVRNLDGPTRRRIRAGLETLDTTPGNLDIAPLTGRAPWRRLRIGEHRVLFRPFTGAEAERFGVDRATW